jgi:alpha-galactosidase
MYIQKPPMGWNTWNTFGPDINEELVLQSADAMVETGLKDAGYEYIVIDDMWSLKERDKDGRWVPDPEKFPHGMKYLADYVHSKGLKFGMYSCGGYMTCGKYPGSYGHEWEDAKQLAEWEVDFLKYDFCFHPASVTADVVYKRMGLALANCGRDILFSACSWGSDNTKQWIRETGAHTWRSTGDINDSWASIRKIATSQLPFQEYNAPGCYNDMDMMVVGMNGEGNCSLTGCTDDEYRLHFSLWAFLNSPLMLGCDIRNMTEETKKIVLNKDIIALNQDPASRPAFYVNIWRYEPNTERKPEDPYYNFRYYGDYEKDYISLAKYLDNGDIAIIMLNFGEVDIHDAPFVVAPDMLGIPDDRVSHMQIKDLWSGETIPVFNGTVVSDLCRAHACRVFRIHFTD